MKAVALTRYLPVSDPDSLLDVELPAPVPTGRDLLVEIQAISVNPVDTKVRAPKDAVEASPKVLGWDAAGVVKAVGEDVTLFTPGDQVYYAGDITRPGSNAELQLVDERIVGRKPRSLGFPGAAAFPLVTLTAWESLFDRLGLTVDRNANAGKSLLIIGAAGGVGSICIQLAKAAGLTVIATASRPETTDWVKHLGTDHVLDHRQPLPPQLQALGFSNGVDFIANFVNTDQYWNAMADMIVPQGKIVCIVSNAQPLDLDVMKAKCVTFVWEFMFTRPKFQTADMAVQGQILNTVADWIDNGGIHPIHQDTVTPINAANLRSVHARLESRTTIGKIVLSGWS